MVTEKEKRILEENGCVIATEEEIFLFEATYLLSMTMEEKKRIYLFRARLRDLPLSVAVEKILPKNFVTA